MHFRWSHWLPAHLKVTSSSCELGLKIHTVKCFKLTLQLCLVNFRKNVPVSAQPNAQRLQLLSASPVLWTKCFSFLVFSHKISAFHSHKNRKNKKIIIQLLISLILVCIILFSVFLSLSKTTVNYTVEGKQAAVFRSWISPLFCNQNPMLKT